MRLAPRKLCPLALALACAPFAHAHGAQAQSPQARVAGQTGQAAKDKPDAKGKPDAKEAARVRRVRQAAVAALREAAEAARSFDDLYFSARIQSEAAAALWPLDEQAARSILRRAWDATNAPNALDKVEGFGTSEDPEEDKRDTLKSARRHVISAAARHDSRLGEEFMRESQRELNGADKRPESETETNDAPRANQRRELSAAGWERLSVARWLMTEGEYKRAAEAALPLVNEGATVPLLNFILSLAAHDAGEADALYLKLLDRTHADPRADANDVLLLSTPIVSPGLQAFVGADGAPQFTRRETGEVAVPSQMTRRIFFQTAAGILLRPNARQEALSAGETAAFYFAVGRLLPFFERELPQFAAPLHARLGALASEVGAARRDSLAGSMGLNRLKPPNPPDPLKADMARIAEATTPRNRDLRRVAAVLNASRLRMWERARGVVNEIEDDEMRQQARRAVVVHQVTSVGDAYGPEEADDFERAAAFVRAADAPAEARAYGLAQAAELAARRGQKARASALLEEAAAHAEQTERGTGQRLVTYALLVRAAARMGAPRVWDLLPTLARAANEAGDYATGALNLQFGVGRPEPFISFSIPAESFQLDEVFAAAARLDLPRTLAEARAIEDEVDRASALVASARAALEREAKK